MDHYQRRALRTWHNDDVPGSTRINHAILGLVGEAGELAEMWKKHQYKPGREYTELQFLDELGDVLYYLVVLAYEWGVTIEHLSVMNYTKLLDGHGWIGSGEKIASNQ